MENRDIVKNGVRIGEYKFSAETAFDEIYERCISKGMNYVELNFMGMLGTPEAFDVRPGEEYGLALAEYLAKHKVYFSIVGGGDRKPLPFSEETCVKMKAIAGEYYMAHNLAERGSVLSCKGAGYAGAPTKPWKSMQEAKDHFVDVVTEDVKSVNMHGVIPATVIESTSMISYEGECGLGFPTIEIWPGDLEYSVFFARGTKTAYNMPQWGCYFAHEWYGGVRNFDELKKKRFKLGYDYCYMNGSSVFVLESGDLCLRAHLDGGDYNNPICQNYRKVMEDFAQFVKQDARPKGGPKVKVAFVRGNLDGFSHRHSGGALWRGHMQPEYGYDAPEFTWRIVEAMKNKRAWCDIHNYGEVDLSGAPAYGTFDIIPATAGVEAFSKYEYLIFAGWNTMTEEIYENLKAFVEQGGRLFMTAAHLNTNDQRNGEISLIRNGDVSDLFGCKLDAENVLRTDSGSRFSESIVPEFMYLADRVMDPYFAEGYIDYAKVELTTGQESARMVTTIRYVEPETLPISLVENKCGDGYAVLMPNLEYPSGAGFAMYQALVREIMTASHRKADIKVYGSDRLRFTVYENGKVYLQNTDYDNKIFATIDYGTHKVEIMLEPCEMKAVDKETL